MISIKEEVTLALNNLNEAELQQVADYVAFLKFRTRLRPLKSLDYAHLANLYTEFAEEDRLLAEEGLEDYVTSLGAEDTQLNAISSSRWG